MDVRPGSCPRLWAGAASVAFKSSGFLPWVGTGAGLGLFPLGLEPVWALIVLDRVLAATSCLGPAPPHHGAGGISVCQEQPLPAYWAAGHCHGLRGCD